MYVAAAIGSGSGSSALGLELALDQPLDRAVGVATRARRPTGSRRWRTCASATSPSDPLGERRARRRPAAAAAAHATGPARARSAPGRGSQTTSASSRRARRSLQPLVEQLGDVGHERRRQRQVALLVGAAVAEHDPLGRPRDARVEQVALAVERVVARSQPQPEHAASSRRQLVGQERVGRAGERELALLQPAHEHGPEAPRADLERLGEHHLVVAAGDAPRRRSARRAARQLVADGR